MMRSKAIAAGFALFSLTLGTAGCSTAFADFDDNAPESDSYPSFSDLPAEPKSVPGQQKWDNRVDSMLATRENLNDEADAAASGEALDVEAEAEAARRKTIPERR